MVIHTKVLLLEEMKKAYDVEIKCEMLSHVDDIPKGRLFDVVHDIWNSLIEKAST